MREKDCYRQKIIKMLEEIENDRILRYIFIIVSDILEDVKKDDVKRR